MDEVTRRIVDLPDEVLLSIFALLPITTRCIVSLVCVKWSGPHQYLPKLTKPFNNRHSISNDPYIWKAHFEQLNEGPSSIEVVESHQWKHK